MKKDNSNHDSLTEENKELAKHILVNWLDSRLKEKGLGNDLKKR